MTTVRINVRPLRKFARQIRNDLRLGGGGLARRMLRQWGVRYLSFVKRRFVKFSRGGGDWKPLAPSTVRGRGRTRSGRRRRRAARAVVRQKGTGGRVAILRNTGTLLSALEIGRRGNLFKNIKGGVRVGFAGAVKHSSGKATIREIAVFHDQGGKSGRPPQRAILVKPDRATVRGMLADAKRAFSGGMKRAGAGAGFTKG